jgi:hypothetical protein
VGLRIRRRRCEIFCYLEGCHLQQVAACAAARQIFPLGPHEWHHHWEPVNQWSGRRTEFLQFSLELVPDCCRKGGSDAPVGTRKSSVTRRILPRSHLAFGKWALVLIGTLSCFEAGSAYLYYLGTGNLFYEAQLRQQQQKAVSVGQGHALKLHPYYGFISAYSNE